MADSPIVAGITPATFPVATDEISGVHHQRMKVEFGADGAATDVSSANPLPVSDPPSRSGTFGYATGTAAGTVDVPAGAKVRRVALMSSGAGSATIVIAGGNPITVPANSAFDEDVRGDVAAGADVVIGGSVATYYVAWTS